MIVTIDGPAGAGKSTIAKRLAEELDFQFLDTGAMYRALTWHAQKSGVRLTAANELATHCLAVPLQIRSGTLWVEQVPMGAEIRTPEVSRDIHYVADNVQIRRHLVDLQRQWVCDANFVSEGRDQGTVAFPSAECKFFLTATPETRARRRQRQLQQQNLPSVYEEILAAQLDRDRRDQSRPEGRLLKAADAITIQTDEMSISEVVAQLANIVQVRLSPRMP
ncbi:MAG: (d)CMP kinase [Planctomycetaceae bacterium]|jgi:CMP/dCMP kinase|nr:(d)CMP kinase [Planctomycetaceae bacterium]